ncbi:MAG: hypothetical protein FK730_02780 [Asgard group archaeon]|nr:hypothetical protein [Asgard group archaeon]
MAINLSITDGWLISLIGKRKKKQIIVTISISLLMTSFLITNIQKVENVDPMFTLVAIIADNVWNDPVYLNYLYIIKHQLKRIGINLAIELLEWNDFLERLTITHDFDMVIFPFSHIPLEDYINVFFSENGSLNIFGYYIEMDFDENVDNGKNEFFIKQINSILPPNSIQRYEMVWDWQFHIMDNIVPCLPLFSERLYQAYWSNLHGYNFSKGLIQSWGHILWDGIHQGQESTNEVVVEDSVSQNPISVAFKSGFTTIPQIAVLDPLIWREGDYTYCPHLAKEWTHITDNQVRLTLREGIKWQDDPDGNFTNEYFDAHDVYFTFKIQEAYLPWFEDCTIINSTSIDMFIKPNPARNQLVNQEYLEELAYIKILPEYYLNQTQLEDGKTPDRNHISWEKYENHFFGTGLFTIEEIYKDWNIKLKINPDSWYLNGSITQDRILNWNTRFGDYNNCPEYLHVNCILDNNLKNLKFLNGEFDIIELGSNNEELINNLEEKQSIELVSKPSDSFSMLCFNMRPVREYIGDTDPVELYPDKKKGWAIRKAIAYAIDRQEINELIHGGRKEIINSPMALNLGKWLHPNMITYCQNYDYANKFADIAGYSLCWCTYPTPEGFPNWEYACTDFSTTTVDVNSYYYLGFLGLIGIIILKRLRKNEKK